MYKRFFIVIKMITLFPLSALFSVYSLFLTIFFHFVPKAFRIFQPELALFVKKRVLSLLSISSWKIMYGFVGEVIILQQFTVSRSNRNLPYNLFAKLIFRIRNVYDNFPVLVRLSCALQILVEVKHCKDVPENKHNLTHNLIYFRA